MKQFFFYWIGISLFLVTSCATLPKKNKWVNLLEGKHTKQWVVKITNHHVEDNYKNTFTIKNGVLSVKYANDYRFDKTFGHVFYNKKLSRYKLKLDYRFKGEQAKGGQAWATRNSGIMIHSESPYNMTKDQLFPMSIEVQLLGGLKNNKPRTTANVCTPGTNIVLNNQYKTQHCINSNSKTYFGDQWVHVEIEVYGNELIIHKINDKEVIRYKKPEIGGGMLENKKYWQSKLGELLASGYICLQSESHPVEFKNIYLMEL